MNAWIIYLNIHLICSIIASIIVLKAKDYYGDWENVKYGYLFIISVVPITVIIATILAYIINTEETKRLKAILKYEKKKNKCLKKLIYYKKNEIEYQGKLKYYTEKIEELNK